MTTEEYLDMATRINKIRDDARGAAETQISAILEPLSLHQRNTVRSYCVSLVQQAQADAADKAAKQKSG